MREGGQFLILSSQSDSAAALSDVSQNLSLDGKDTTNSQTEKKNGEEFSLAEEEQARFSVVKDQKLIDKLNSEETIKTYRSMQLIDGKLYPPMASRVNGDFLFFISFVER